MALTFTEPGSGKRIDHQVHGMTTKQVIMTTSTGGGSTDYSSGFDINTNRAKMGFRTIFGVYGATAAVAAGTVLPLVWCTWNHATGKLQVADATSEAHGAGTIDAGGTIRMFVVGV